MSRRDLALVGGGARIRLHRVLHPHFCVRLCALDGVTLEESVTVDALGRGLRAGRSRLHVALDGEACIRLEGRDHPLRPGTLCALPDLHRGMERAQGRIRSLEIDWDPGTIGEDIRTSEIALGAMPRDLPALVTRLAAAEAHEVEPLVRQIFAALRAVGAPFVELDQNAFHDPMALRYEPLSWAIDALFSNPDSRPMAVDLETTLGCSPRSLVRLVTAFNDHYALEGLGGTSWRKTRDFWRLLTGSILMTSQAARTSTVAETLGYGSTEALCHAFANAGLPAPGSIRQRVST